MVYFIKTLFSAKVILIPPFYSAILSALEEKHKLSDLDALFIQCGGKHRMPLVIKALQKLNVPIRTICDFDVLNEKIH